MSSVEDFKKTCNSLSLEFAKIDKRKHLLENLKKAHLGPRRTKSEAWLPCCRPGVPCSSRANIFEVGYTNNSCKTLITVCPESKYCIHSTMKKLK